MNLTEFHIIINLLWNEKWDQRHKINKDDADKWDIDENDHDNDDDNDDDDECQKKVWCVSLLN